MKTHPAPSAASAPHADDLDDLGPELLRLARETIDAYLQTGRIPAYSPADSRLLPEAAVFVTLRVRPNPGEDRAETGEETAGRLRGCVGQIEADRPLYRAVQESAIKAATCDPRFEPVSPEELDELAIEISILSDFRVVYHENEIEIGRDGLLVDGGGRRGLLLPQVPLMFGWDRRAFVRNVCRKAGLPDDAWPEFAQLYAFTTVKLAE